MKTLPFNWITGEIFAQCPGHFCRVPGAVAGNCSRWPKKMPFFQLFYGRTDLFSGGTTVAKQPLRTKLI